MVIKRGGMMKIFLIIVLGIISYDLTKCFLKYIIKTYDDIMLYKRVQVLKRKVKEVNPIGPALAKRIYEVTE